MPSFSIGHSSTFSATSENNEVGAGAVVGGAERVQVPGHTVISVEPLAGLLDDMARPYRARGSGVRWRLTPHERSPPVAAAHLPAEFGVMVRMYVAET